MSRLDYCKNELIRHNCYDWKCNHCDGCNIFKAYCEEHEIEIDDLVKGDKDE